MTTHGNLSGSVGKPPDGFEASGLSPDQAERLAAEFKPSWELDDAPGAHPVHAVGHANGSYGSPQLDARHALGDAARTVAPHAPPPRVETHEPEVSVIIDRSITAAEMDLQRGVAPAARPAPLPHAGVVAAFPAQVANAPPQRVAPVLRPPRSPDESLELTASLKKSNKGLFLGLGVAAIAAVLVLVVHGAMSSSDATTAASPTAAPATTADTARAAAASPIPPPPAVTHAALIPPPAAPAPAVASPARPAAPARAPAAVRPPPAPAHHAPRNPPKPAAGGIVRDNPF